MCVCVSVCEPKLFVLFILNFAQFALLKFIVSVQARLDGFIWHTTNRFSLPRLSQVVCGSSSARLSLVVLPSASV